MAYYIAINQIMSTKHVGDQGEAIAAKYLSKQGFTVIETNYRKKWGELDIIAKQSGSVHFVEVKTHSYPTKAELLKRLSGDNYRPEELVHRFKLHQLERIIQTWLAERKWEGEWQLDVVAVRIAEDDRYATINHLQNVVV
ncbi:YraN family protein [Candidatus Pacebacteria bacterium]|nr:YraN family protein [Candidatus Paceibacterota bacterium]